jgi:hypothetical protein
MHGTSSSDRRHSRRLNGPEAPTSGNALRSKRTDRDEQEEPAPFGPWLRKIDGKKSRLDHA